GVISAPRGAPRSAESSIGQMGGVAHYDGVADWYDRELATAELGRSSQRGVLRILGEGTGRLLDLGCGGGAFAAILAEQGWQVTGVDISKDQLRLARSRGVDPVLRGAGAPPLAD